VRCFTATYENKIFQHAAFLLSTLVLHVTELSKVFQAGCFNFTQMKASVELCINKLSDAAAKSKPEANCEKFDSELGELRTLDGLAECVKWHGVLSGHRKVGRPSPYTKSETGVNEQLPRHLFAQSPRKSVCQDVAKIIEPKLDNTQCGFRRGRSTIDQSLTLQQIFEKSWEHPKDLCRCFVNLGKVYGRVP